MGRTIIGMIPVKPTKAAQAKDMTQTLVLEGSFVQETSWKLDIIESLELESLSLKGRNERTVFLASDIFFFLKVNQFPGHKYVDERRMLMMIDKMINCNWKERWRLDFLWKKKKKKYHFMSCVEVCVNERHESNFQGIKQDVDAANQSAQWWVNLIFIRIKSWEGLGVEAEDTTLW